MTSPRNQKVHDMPVMNEEYMIREEAAAYEDRGDNLPDEGSEQKPAEGEEAKSAEGEGAKPKGEEAKPTGEEAKPTGEEAKPAEGEGEKPAEGEQSAEGETDDGKQQPGPGWVPRHRYNSQARRARELEQRIQQLEQGQQPAGEQAQPQGQQTQPQGQQATGSEGVQQQLTEVNGKITQAIREGSAEGLDDLYKQQLELQAQYAREVAQEAAQTATRSTNDETAYDRRISEVEQEYPQLNPDNENTYDDGMAARVETLRDAFVSKGYSMTDALDEALTTLEPLLTPAQQSAAAAADKEGDGRTQEALRRNAEAATQQPAAADAGTSSDQHGHTANGPDIASMTEEEFDALPEETKKRARGDDG